MANNRRGEAREEGVISMCFSATASFVASGILSAGGVVTLTKVRSKREIPIAIVPLLFAVQQFMEGVQWLSDKPSTVSTVMAHAFLAFAFLWPAYIPFSIFLIEPRPFRKKILSVLLGLGIAVSGFLLFRLIKNSITVSVVQNHIEYFINLPWTWGLIPYTLAAAGSCLVSSYRMILWLGIGVLISFAASLIFYIYSFGSVWCFFSAILSLLVYFHFREKKMRVS